MRSGFIVFNRTFSHVQVCISLDVFAKMRENQTLCSERCYGSVVIFYFVFFSFCKSIPISILNNSFFSSSEIYNVKYTESNS